MDDDKHDEDARGNKLTNKKRKGQKDRPCNTDEWSEIKLYAIVSFPDDGGALKSVDMIPRHWIPKPKNSEEPLQCYYSPDICDEQAKTKFRKMIQYCEPFDKSWPLHRIEIRGSAGNTHSQLNSEYNKLFQQ